MREVSHIQDKKDIVDYYNPYLYRLLALLGAFVIPLFGFVKQEYDPAAYDPFTLRIFFSFLLLAFVAGSFFSAYIKKRITYFVYFFYYALSGYFMYLTYKNNFDIDYAIGLLLIVFSANLIGFRKTTHLAYYFLFVVTCAILAFFRASLPEVDAPVFMIFLFTIFALSYLVLQTRYKMQEELGFNENLLHTIYHESADALYIIDPESGIILDCNKSGVDILEADNEAEVIGSRISRFVQNPEFLKELNSAGKTGKITRKEGKIFSVKDNEVWTDWVVKKIQPNSKEFLLVRLTNISERRKVEEEFYLLHKLSTDINNASGLEDALAVILQNICKTTDWIYGEAWVKADDRNELYLKEGYYGKGGRLKELYEISKTVAFKKGEGFPGSIWKKHEVELILNLKERKDLFPYRYEAIKNAGLNAAFSIPISVDNNLLAALVFYMSESAPRDSRLIDLVVSVGTQLGALLKRKITEAQLQEAYDIMEKKVIERTAELSATNNQLLLEIEEREKAEAKIRDSERLLKEAQNIAHIGSWEWDIQKDRISWSEELFKIYGIKNGRIIDYNTYIEYAHPDDQQHIDEILNQAIKDQNPFHFQHRLITPQYEVRYLECRGRVITNEKGEVVKLCGVAQDITHQKRTEEKTRNLMQKLKESNQELEEFAFIVSHDLKAPLRGIISLSNWIVEDYKDILDKEGKENLFMLRKRTKHMEDLIEGILHYSRIGRSKESLSRVNLNDLVKNIIESIDPPKHISISLDNQLPQLYCGKVSIMQLFQNLISNAIKYIDKEEGHVHIGCRESEDEWEFYIKDNGKGIEKKYYDKIFRIFQTLERNNPDSTGVGLTIVQKIIKQYGGEIWLESEPGNGTTFYFTIPRKEHELLESVNKISQN